MSLDISPYTILLADDDDQGLRLAEEILSTEGFEVDAVNSGDRAWDRVSEHASRYDAVILDQRMPGKTGMQVLNLMKSRADTREIPVVLLSGLQDVDTVVEGIRAGAYYYVSKPYDPELLLSVLRTAIEDHRSHVDLRRRLESTISAVRLLEVGRFSYRHMDEARALAGLLANLAPEPEKAVVGLWELMLNAVEHGNLEISYDKKSELLREGAWLDEISGRQKQPEYARRKVSAFVERDGEWLVYRIIDEGHGFDAEPFLDFQPQRATHAHGRGIALARRMSFTDVRYIGRGNEVEARISLSTPSDADGVDDHGDTEDRARRA